MTLRLTVDTEAWRRHVDHVARHCPGLVPVVKGNGYGFGRAELAGVAAGLADTIAVGTVHELDHVPGRRHARRADADAGGRPTTSRRSSPSARSTTSAALAGWPGRVLVKLVSSVRRFGVAVDDLGPVTRAARAAGLDIVGFSVHPPVAGTDDEHLDDIASWLDVLHPDDEVWVSHLSTDGYRDLRDALAGPPLPHPARHRAVARRQAQPCTSAPTCSTSARSAPASTPATGSSGCRTTAAS